MGGILITTDNESILIKKYWLDLILAQTKQHLTKEELELEDIDNLYYMCEDFYMYLSFNKRNIGKESFAIFYKRCLQAYIDYPKENVAKAHWIDFRSGRRRDKENILEDYLNPEIIKEILDYGKQEGYLNDTEEKKKDFQNYVDTVLLWWGRFLDFLKENYGKPKQE